MAKPVQLRRLAAADVDAALEHYLSEAGAAIAGRFVDALEHGLAPIGRHPRNGSLRFSYELDIPELRTWPLTRFPYLLFHVEHDARIDLWRVLHTRRDLPGAFAVNPDEERAT